MTSPLRGHVAVVTGAAGGIGAAIAQGLLAAGADLAAIDLAPFAPGHLAPAAEGQRVRTFQADATDTQAVAAVCRAVEAELGPVSVLVNNVGGSGPVRVERLEDLTDAIWDDVLSLNLGSIIRFSRALVPAMQGRGYGRIINISSALRNGIFGSTGIPGARLPYVTAKSAIVGLTKQLAKDLGPSGITVNAIAPGFTLPGEDARVTRNFRSLPPEHQQRLTMNIPAGRPASGSDVANAAVFLALPESGYISGEIIAVTGGSDT